MSIGLPPSPRTGSTRSGRASAIWVGWTNWTPMSPRTTPRQGSSSDSPAHVRSTIWGGLIGIYTDRTVKSDSLELRPFIGPKFLGLNRKEVALLQLDSIRTPAHRNARHGRVEDRAPGPQSDPHRDSPRVDRPGLDAEERGTCWRTSSRSTAPRLDRPPLRLRAPGPGFVTSRRALVEFHDSTQYTRPDSGGLAYTDNILRLNFKIALTKGISLTRLLDGGVDD